ncbi:MAG: DeoR/GlpR family DNA-binding transcription regulator [Actinomycetota bacterium]
MYQEERRHSIAELVRRDGRGDAAELAARFRVTQETVRRDLIDLEQRGVLRRVHGGAIPVERFRLEPAVAEKAGLMAEEKRRIAAAALEYIPRGGSILLDAGTTTGALAAMIPSDRDLTVVTNSLPNAMTVAARPSLNLLLVGGRVRGRTLADVDDWALRSLSDLSVDVAFIAANGVSVERGLSTPDLSEAAVKRAMVATGRRVVLLADHTKVGDQHFARFAEITDVDIFVTDRGLSANEVEAFERAGPKVVLA